MNKQRANNGATGHNDKKSTVQIVQINFSTNFEETDSGRHRQIDRLRERERAPLSIGEVTSDYSMPLMEYYGL